jgi:hypothetical protein
MICPACTTNNWTDILPCDKNKNINRRCVPFVPRVSCFHTLYRSEKKCKYDTYSRVKRVFYYILKIFIISLSRLYHIHHMSLFVIWGEKGRDRRDRWDIESIATFISVPLENSEKCMMGQMVRRVFPFGRIS